MLGIEKTKKLASYLVNNVAEDLQKKLADGKFSLAEKISFIGNQLPLVGLINDREEIINELKDIDYEERDEIITFIMSEYDYDSERSQKLVNGFADLLRAINNLVDIFENE